MTLFAGTNKAGTWRASLTIPAGTSGIHYVCFQATDIAGNTTRIAWAIQQELSPPPDTAKPVVVDGSGTINKSSGTAESQFIVTFRATDDVGVNDISGIIRNAQGEVVTVRGSNQRSSGTALDGIWTVTVTVPTGTPLGQYSIFGRAQDLGNNAGTPNSSSEILIGTIQITS